MSLANGITCEHPDGKVLQRCTDLAILIIKDQKTIRDLGEYKLEMESFVNQSGKVSGFTLTQNVPGMFTPGEISVGVRHLVSFGISESTPHKVHGYYANINNVLPVLENIVWRYWVLEPALLEITTKLAKSGTGKLSIKTAEHMWNFSFLGTTTYVEIVHDFAIRKLLSARWELVDDKCVHVYCSGPYRAVNILIYEMLRQQGLV